jgi:hypothetical protein
LYNSLNANPVLTYNQTYSPTGTSSSGSVYICGRSKTQYVIRILGDTGRTRILRFDAPSGQWAAQ